MATAENHGMWNRYTPDFSGLPLHIQAQCKKYIYFRRAGDNSDFNDYRASRADVFNDDTVSVSAILDEGRYLIQSASGGGMPAYPDERYLFTVNGWEGPVEPLVRHYIDATTLEVLEMPVVTPVPTGVTDVQFYQQLCVEGIITQDEALAAVQVGALPAAIQTAISSIPENLRFNAQMTFSGSKVIVREHPVTADVFAALGRDGAQTDAFFHAAALL